MDYEGPFKDIVSKAEKEYEAVRRKESDNYLLNETLLKLLNKTHSVKTLDDGLNTAMQYATDIANTIEAIKSQRESEAFVEEPIIAADIFWKYQSHVMDRLKANTDLQGESLEVVVSGLKSRYPKPTEVGVAQIKDKFMEFISAVEKFYKEKPKEVPVEEIHIGPVVETETREIEGEQPKEDLTLLVGRYTSQMYLVEMLLKDSPIHIKGISKKLSTEKQELKFDLETLSGAGLISRPADKQEYSLTSKGLRVLLLENTDADTVHFLENISRYESGCLNTTPFNYGRSDGIYKIPNKSTLNTLKKLSIVELEEQDKEVKIVINERINKLL